jgi:hypothetical protein
MPGRGGIASHLYCYCPDERDLPPAPEPWLTTHYPPLHPHRLSLNGLREAASNKAARQAFHAHLAPWPPSEPEAAAAAAVSALTAQPSAAAAAAAEAGFAVDVLSNGSMSAPAAVQGGDGLAPWDTVEFTDDELRAQLRHVIGGLPP